MVQPSNKQGRNLRLTLLPLSWVIAGLTVYLVLLAVASVTHSTVRGVMRTGSYWMLAVILPALLFGKCLGLVALNLLARAIPAFRQTFERECAETGRHGFAKATSQLLGLSLVLGVLTVFGCVCFVTLTRCKQHNEVVEVHPNIASLQTAIEVYEIDTGRYPDNLMKDLWVPNPVPLGYGGPYIRSTNILSDSWGTLFRYRRMQTGFELRSAGPDRRFDTADDMVTGAAASNHHARCEQNRD